MAEKIAQEEYLYYQLKNSIKQLNQGQLTTLIKDVMFHKAYTRARPADRLGP